MTTSEKLTEWFQKKVPEGWFTKPVEVQVDSEEILVVGALAADAGVKAFREDTRDERIGIAAEAEHRFGRKVSWGVEVDGERLLFTHIAVPVMTRLRMAERTVLDTLVESGVARSRSDALAWCVRLVGKHESEWLAELREALVAVQKVRSSGPAASRKDKGAAPSGEGDTGS